MASMTEADQTAMMMALQRELAEMKKAHEEAAKKNEEEIKNLQEENKRMKKLVEGVPSLAMTNQAGRSHATGAGIQAEKDTKNDFTLEMDGESHPSKTINTTAPAGPDRRHPFTDRVMETPLPDKWKGFNRDRYDGTTDPDEHVDAYTTHMSLYTTDDAVFCRVFPTSLKGSALSWFTKLPAHSIDCFETLIAKFDVQFATSRPHHLTSIALVGIRQERGESLRTFIDRFSKTAMSIRNLSPEVAMHHMLTALRPGPFADSLCMQPVTNLDDLRRQAAKFMQLEELREFRNNARAEASGEKKEDRERQGRSRTGRDQKRDNRGLRFSRYTPLNAERSKILQEALSAELIPSPRRALSPENADRNKRCRYHKNTGHSTEECQALKDKIEELIQAGHLRCFVRGTRETRRSPCKEQTLRRRDRTPQARERATGGETDGDEETTPHKPTLAEAER
ncbi:uncharacterized protein [Phaseolus vulgaris]|uniref:uncharacterized protein n=1 Tax=Phaseolus vulgaris TaxID=3885 RepID=UPI0035CC5AFE